MGKKRLGELLLERGRISADDLHQTIQEQRGKLLLLGELLLERGTVSKADLIAALEDVTRVVYLDCLSETVATDALELIPRDTALRYCVLPVARQGKKLVTVMAEPQNLRILDELRFIAGMEISPRLGFRAEIHAAISKNYADPRSASSAANEQSELLEPCAGPEIEFFSASSRESAQEAMREFQADLLHRRTPAVHMVSKIVSTAVAKQASDIHIEPQATGTIVRLRVDGLLHEFTRVTGKVERTLVSRIKVLADMDIGDRRSPQDGRFVVQLAGKKIDVRVSTLPAQFGEKVVLRLLGSGAPDLKFEDLGFSPDNCQRLDEILSLPQGMLLATGPTGSGKTTTLYAALSHIRKAHVNIVTVEDPIEYVLEGINQIQVNVKAGLTFASCLRSMLRQDPNIIMVGEIRDLETAEIALKAAQTGHLVLSTLHTNDSIAAVIRLLDLGIPAYLIASSLTAVISQRLTRRLCTCRAEVPVTPEYIARLTAAGIQHAGEKMYAPVGCAECDNTGYRGRAGVHELLVLEEQIRNLIRSGAPPEEIRILARSVGMKLMRNDAMEKVKRGITTIAEVMRVVRLDHSVPDGCRSCGKELLGAFLFCPYCGTKRKAGTEPKRRAARGPKRKAVREPIEAALSEEVV